MDNKVFPIKIKKIKDGYKLEFTINAPLMYHKIILSWFTLLRKK